MAELEVDVVDKEFPTKKNNISKNLNFGNRHYRKKTKTKEKTIEKEIHDIPSRPNGFVIPALQRLLHSNLGLVYFLLLGLAVNTPRGRQYGWPISFA